MINLVRKGLNSMKSLKRNGETLILITGGAGFIGQHLVKELSKEFEIIVLDNLSSGKLENILKYDVNFVKGDICDEKKVEKVMRKKIDYVFHLAAQVSIEKSVKNPIFDAKTNILGTINLLKYAEKYRVKKFVYFSSAAVYGKPQRLPIDENHPTKPLSPYGLSKLTGERYCELFNIPHVILRIFNVYGIGQQPENPYSGVISKFMDNVKKNESLEIFGDGNQYRDFVHVKDVVRAAKIALSHEGTFNIGCGEKATINQLAEKILKLSKKDLKIVFRERREEDIQESVADIKMARKVLGWEPTIGLDEGLTDMVI